METDLSSKYDVRVPRYTSYPTAPHFNDGVNAEQYRRWLRALPKDTALSLYFHIPFCDEMCWFCGCYTKIVKRYQPVADYLDVLLAEIDLVAAVLPARFQASHLHWGGGSPTMLKGNDWQRTMDALRHHFEVSGEAEVAVELDPRTATEDYVRGLGKAGVNRASIGVQDFDRTVQEAIHRIQPFDVTERVVGWLRRHGIDDINMDLMYGLPHQTVERVTAMVDLAVRLKPARVALFGYAHVPWMKSHQKMIDETALPDGPERWRQFTAAAERLVEMGYVKIGLDHFALPGDEMAKALTGSRLRRNFQGYTVDVAPVLLGFGASAIGRLPWGYIQNVAPLNAYRLAVGDGDLPTARGVAFSDDDRLRGDIIERLMCDLRADIGAICREHGAKAEDFTAEMEKLAPLAADGIVTVEAGRIAIPEEGRAFVRLVAAVFDAYLDDGQRRHSKAV